MNETLSAFNILKKKLSSYEDRPQQIEMAEAVLTCLKDNKRLLAEGGTGIGKSFAYLIPAILSGEKTVISTASIALQDQLINKDLKFLQKTLDQKFSFAMLKGKNNYLCMKREREFSELTDSFMKFRNWAAETETGDKDELHFIPDFWASVCGDSDDCSVNLCAYFMDCFYYRHYRSLYEKDILVVNHHLLMYDVLSDFKLLPFHEQLIIDEAHQIEGVISDVLGSTLNYVRVMWLLYRLRGLKIAVDHLFEPVDSFFKRKDVPLGTVTPVPEAIIEALSGLKDMFAFDKVINRLNAGKESLENGELKDRIETTVNYIKALEITIADFIKREDEDKVYYMTVNKNGLELRSSLVECGGPFVNLADGYSSVVMTSATMTVGGSFGFLKERLGITDFREMVIDSPFDFRKQAVLFIDKDLPSPVKENSRDFQDKSLEVIERLINASKGRALVLFTSYAHLRFVSENIKTDYEFKSQGDMPPARLIDWFKKTANPVLLATATFWQGIDIKGEKLSMVIIVKLPFGSPGDPVYDEKCRRLGGQWFSSLALPSAILTLRQGIGRLIRGTSDYGVNAILDTRIIKSSYGKTIISSIPGMKVVHRIKDVEEFFKNVPDEENSVKKKKRLCANMP